MKRLLIYFSILALVSGCRKDTDNVSTTSTTSGFVPTAIYVNGTVAGQVVSESGTVLSNVPVRLGTYTTLTTDEGFFVFRNVPLNTRGAYIQIDYPGYWHASRRVVPKHNETHYTALTLMPKQYDGQVNAAEGGTVSLSGGMSVSFEPNSFATADGTPFQGTVVLATRWLDPTQAETKAMMPGALHGLSAANKEVTLKNYGIAAVELISASGETVQIADGASAVLSFPVPAQLAGDAPAAIAMWHFDEAAGYWREEGMALRDGNMYTGQVSHFTFWSVNESFETVMLTGTVVNNNDQPLANTQVSVLFQAQNAAATGYTDANGVFSGLVPSGESLVLVVSGGCNTPVFVQNIPPLSNDIDLGTLQVSADEVSTTTLSGNLTNCDGSAVGSGIVVVCWPQGCQFIMPNPDGSFSQTFTWCNTSDFTIAIVDYSTGETYSATESAQPELDLGTVQVCEGPLETFISLNFNGTERFYPFPNQYIQFGKVYLRAEDSNYSLRLSIPEASTGTYSGDDISFNYYDNSTNPDIPLFLVSGSCFFGECTDLAISITAYGAVGEFIEGSYAGTVDFTTSTESFPNAPISGSFRVVRGM